MYVITVKLKDRNSIFNQYHNTKIRNIGINIRLKDRNREINLIR